MIRVSSLLVLLALGTALAVVADANAGTAMTFTFVGFPLLGLGVALYAWTLWRPVQLTSDERALYDLAFRALGEREFADLLVLGTWGEADAGTHMVRAGDRVEDIKVLLSGSVTMRMDGEEDARLGPGQLIGIVPILTEVEAWGEAVVSEPIRFFSWPADTLQRAVEKKPRLRATLQSIVSRQLAEKLRELSGGGSPG